MGNIGLVSSDIMPLGGSSAARISEWNKLIGN
jgi:hypothetical protein